MPASALHSFSKAIEIPAMLHNQPLDTWQTSARLTTLLTRFGIRVLGEGELKAKLEIEVAGASASARAAIEKAGGTLSTTFKKKAYMNKKGEAGKRVQRRQKSAEKRSARAVESGATA